MKVLLAPGSNRTQKIVGPLRAVGIDVRAVAMSGEWAMGKLSLLGRSFMTSLTDRSDIVLTDVCSAQYLPCIFHEFLDRRPIVLRPRGDMWQEDANRANHRRFSSIRNFYSPRVLNYFYRRADAVVPVSHFLASAIAGHAGMDPEALTAIWTPVDMERFAPVPAERSLQLRAELGVDSRYLVCVVTSFEYDDKVEGLERFLPVLRALVEQDPEVCVVIAGAGPRHAAFMTRNTEVLGHPRLIAKGYVTRIEQVYQAADLFAHFTFFDGLPSVLFEAWACGIPAVVNDYGACTEALLPGETGCVLRNDACADEAVPVIQSLLHDERQRRIMGDVARQYAVEHTSAEAIGRQFLALFESLLS